MIRNEKYNNNGSELRNTQEIGIKTEKREMENDKYRRVKGNTYLCINIRGE